jgi:DNA-binding CsgD family transcriptional regulator
MADGLQALTEREKEALRLLVRGHDAKSLAREDGQWKVVGYWID